MADDTVIKAQEELDLQIAKIAWYNAQQLSIKNGMDRELARKQDALIAAQTKP